MSAIQNLIAAVEEAALGRNHEVIAAIMNHPDLDKCCCHSRVYWHILSLKKRIYKVDVRIRAKYQMESCGIDPWWYVHRNQKQHYDEKLSLAALECLKDDLTKQVQEDRIHLANLEPCGTCPGCAYRLLPWTS